jgi:polyribonucleotide nucleotidyltransferase
LGAVLFADQVVIDAIAGWLLETAKPTWDWQPKAENVAEGAIRSEFGETTSQAYHCKTSTSVMPVWVSS